MSLVETNLLNALTRALDLTAQRQNLLTQNVANIDTPGYHARDIDFRRQLEQALDFGDEQAAPVFAQEVPGLVARPDGNNVDIDRESLLMAQNQLQYQTEVALLRSEMNRLQTAISGGTGQ